MRAGTGDSGLGTREEPAGGCFGRGGDGSRCSTSGRPCACSAESPVPSPQSRCSESPVPSPQSCCSESRVPSPESRSALRARRAKRAKGFTLLEVIAAIAILGLAFVVLLKAMGASMAVTQKSAERTQATLWAQSLLDSRFAMHPPSAGVTRGRFDERYSWSLDVRPWQPPPPTRQAAPRDATDADIGGVSDLRLYRLDLTVTWGPQERRQAAHFSTLRAAYAPVGGP